MLTRALTAGLMFFAIVGAANADATIPSKDIPNARDNQLLKRYDGSFIVSYERLAFTDFKVPLSKLERTGDSDRDRMNNQVYSQRRRFRSKAPGPVSPTFYLRDARRWKCCAIIRMW